MILYLHGFSSAGASSKAALLAELLSPMEIIHPTYPAHSPDEAIELLQTCIAEYFSGSPPLLIGSSLGGYYAQYLASQHSDARAVLINPSLQPWSTLKSCVGRNTNMVTGEIFEFSKPQLDALPKYDVPAHALAGRCMVLVDEKDEVIDYRYAVEKYRLHGSVHVYPDGNHRFEHISQALPLIRTFFKIQ